jgi:hypothetical protein
VPGSCRVFFICTCIYVVPRVEAGGVDVTQPLVAVVLTVGGAALGFVGGLALGVLARIFDRAAEARRGGGDNEH